MARSPNSTSTTPRDHSARPPPHAPHSPPVASLIRELTPLLEGPPSDQPELLVAAVATRLANLPPVMTPEEIATLLRVDVKVVYRAVAELSLPMRPVGRRKCLRGLTLAILLWLANHWPLPAAVDDEGQGHVVADTKKKRQ